MSEKKIYIKYFLIGDLDTCKPISEYSTKYCSSDEKKTLYQVFKKISKTEERQYEERNIISAKEGNKYYFISYQPNIVFIAFVDGEYQDRLVFQMFEEIKSEDILSMVDDSTKELDSNGRQKLKEIIEKYQDKEKIDKIAAIQQDVNECKVEVKKNIDKMVQNVEDVEKLQEKSNELKDASEDYKDKAEEVRKISCWKNFKLWILIIFIILVCLGFILFLILKN